MRNNTFFIVVREKDQEKLNPYRFGRVAGRLYGGWEFTDGIEIFDYQEAKKLRKEYELAMPSHIARIHCKQIEK